MDATLQQKLTSKRELVINRFNAKAEEAKKMNKAYNCSMRDFFNNVVVYFEAHPGIARKSIKDNAQFMAALNHAINSAEYAMAAAQRRNNRQYFNFKK